MAAFQQPAHYSVTQMRSAVSCPRVFYFDAVHGRKRGKPVETTRLWKSGAGDETTACGSLFHQTIERFNSAAASDVIVAESLEKAVSIDDLALKLQHQIYFEYLKIDSLGNKSGEQQQNFLSVLRGYVYELASFLWNGRLEQRPIQEILSDAFSERRRRVDVTFHVGPNGEPVEVVGILDYMFHDSRVGHDRILDYKLTPPTHISDDLLQVCTYALMHHQQRRTEPAAGVLYLHPERQLIEKPWADIWHERSKVYNLLASMREWEQFDEQTQQGLKPPGEPAWCSVCRWNNECDARLGPKHEGSRLDHWKGDTTDAAHPATTATLRESLVAEPQIIVQRIDEGQALRNFGIGSSTVVSPDLLMANSETPKCLTPAQKVDSRNPADIPNDALFLGQIPPVGTLVTYTARHLVTHTAVVGAAGSGKTWMAKVIAEEAIRRGIPVLAIDPQGDLVQFLRRTSLEKISAPLRPLYDEFDRRVETRIYTPGTSHATRLSLSPLRMPSDADLAHLKTPERRREELDGILAATAGNLVDLAAIGGEEDSQRTLVFKILAALRNRPSATVGLNDIVSGLMAPDGLGIDNADMILKKADREKLARKLYAFIEGPASNLFRDGVPLNLDHMVKADDPSRTPLNIIYLNALPGDQEKQFFLAMLAEEVYRWMLTTPSSAERPSLLFYLDEARDFIPAGTRNTPAKASLLRLFTQGRKYGVGCLLCTQSPRSVDYNAFGNCSTKIIGRLEAAQDVERVEEWFTKDGPAPAWIKARKGANPGSFVARWPEMPRELYGQAFASRPLFSSHGGAWSADQLESECR